MKRWLANLFIVILLLSLTGCISYKENNKETERDTIVISVLAGQSTSDAGVEDMVDEWMEKNFPQVYLEWECVDWGCTDICKDGKSCEDFRCLSGKNQKGCAEGSNS